MAIQQQQVARSGATTNLADILERVLDKGIVIAGDIKLILGEIEVLTLQIRLVVCSVDKAKEMGMDWWVNNPAYSSQARRDVSLTEISDRLARLEDSLTGEKKKGSSSKKQGSARETP